MRRPAYLLQGALAYAVDVAGALPADVLDRPTPCPGWDVRTLVRHLAVGLAVLGGDRAPVPPDDPVPMLVETACLLLTRPVTLPPRAEAVAATGAIEVAVHTWDLTRACGDTRPVPSLIAADLLLLAPRVVPGALRPRLFAAPVDVPVAAAAGDRLVAFLGRRPAPSG
jgi:uncharacterized protein (TIGR03083 family)